MKKQSKQEKISEFNKNNKPFYLIDHNDEISLCYVINPTPFETSWLCQKAFDRYAETIGDPVQENGLFTHGSGYEWEYAFRKLYEDDPNIGKLSFDSEAGGFFCYGRDVDMMADFGRRFREVCKDEAAFFELICKAIPEGEQMTAESIRLSKTFKGFLMSNPGTDVDLKTPQGRIHISAEMNEKLIDGTLTKVLGDGFYADAEELLNMKVKQKNRDIFDENHFQVAVDYFDDQELAEDFKMTM